MAAGVLRQAKFDGCHECLRNRTSVHVHIPGLPDEPILKVVKGDFPFNQAFQFFPDSGCFKHDRLS